MKTGPHGYRMLMSKCYGLQVVVLFSYRIFNVQMLWFASSGTVFIYTCVMI